MCSLLMGAQIPTECLLQTLDLSAFQDRWREFRNNEQILIKSDYGEFYKILSIHYNSN
jgi:hypothetical protein